MADHLPDNTLSILACPHCRAFPLQTYKDDSLLCPVCSTVYPQRNGILDLRPPGYDKSGAYQGDPPEAARLRNQWDSTRLRSKRGIQAAIEQVVRHTFPGCQILDAGCGTGHITRWIAERATAQTQLWATDVSEAMCQLARQNCKGLDQVTVVRAVSQSPMPFPQGTFDVLFARLAPMDVELAHDLLRPEGWYIESGYGEVYLQEIHEIFRDRRIVFPRDEREPKERLIQSGFAEAEFHSWRYTRYLTLDEIVSNINFAPILESFDEEEDASLLEMLRRRHGTCRGIALTVEDTLLIGRKTRCTPKAAPI